MWIWQVGFVPFSENVTCTDQADDSDNDFSLIMDEYINGRSYNLTSDQSERLRILDQKRGNRQWNIGIN